jgi:hypothetical protein
MPNLPRHTVGAPVAVDFFQAEALSGLSRTKLRKAGTEGVQLPDGSTFKLDMRKHGSSTLIIFKSLCRLIEALPPYTGAPTPESRKMIETRKREAAKQRARREVMTAAE